MDNISRFQKTTGVGQILDESFARCPEREAIVFGDWRITYRELQALIYRTAHCLRSLGIAPGDRSNLEERLQWLSFAEQSGANAPGGVAAPETDVPAPEAK